MLIYCRLPVAAVVLLVTSTIATADDDIRVADGGLFARLDANADGQLASDELPEAQARLFTRLLSQGDKNKDGRLSESERQRAIEPRRPAKPIEEKRPSELPGADAARLLLLKLDVDQDGVLTEEEAPAELRVAFRQVVGEYDRNKDGRINSLELARGGPRLTRIAQQMSRRLDWNVESELAKLDKQQGDRAMRFTERPTPQQLFGDSKRAQALFEELDRNQDGKLQRDELPEQAKDRLERLFRFGDRDRDDALSQREFLAASQRAARFLRRTTSGSE